LFKSAVAGRQNPGYQLLTQPLPFPLSQGSVYWCSVRLVYENLVDTFMKLRYKTLR